MGKQDGIYDTQVINIFEVADVSGVEGFPVCNAYAPNQFIEDPDHFSAVLQVCQVFRVFLDGVFVKSGGS